MAWDHAIRELTAGEMAHAAEWDAEQLWRYGTVYNYSRCGTTRCTAPAKWKATWRRVTGRRGNVGCGSRHLCDAHAEQFRRRHVDGTPPVAAEKPL